jgi:hypothetical protein
MLYFLSLLLFFQSNDTPSKAKEEYSVDINFQFKPHPGIGGSGSTQKIRFNEATAPPPENRFSGGQYPYVKLTLALLKLSDEETKMKITDTDGNSVYNKKVKQGAIISLDLGFVDEMKERTSSTEYDCVLMTDKKKKISKIHILIDKEGTYFVNGAKMGKF